MKTLAFCAKLAAVCVAVALSGQAALASVQFDIGPNGPSGNNWSLGTGWGTGSGQLDAIFRVDPGLPNVAFSLNEGQTKCFTFGTVQLRESDISTSETDHLGVTANLLFNLPNVGQVQNPGRAVAFTGTVGDCNTDLKITFDPVYVDFGNCGTFKVDLTNLCFDRCETLCVSACVTLCKTPCPDVPEPATIVIWGLLGLAGLAVRRGRR